MYPSSFINIFSILRQGYSYVEIMFRHHTRSDSEILTITKFSNKIKFFLNIYERQYRSKMVPKVPHTDKTLIG